MDPFELEALEEIKSFLQLADYVSDLPLLRCAARAARVSVIRLASMQSCFNPFSFAFATSGGAVSGGASDPKRPWLQKFDLMKEKRRFDLNPGF